MPKILVVDDDPLILQMVSEALRADYVLLSADRGGAGIELARQHHPDLILCDISMPDMSGFEVLRVLKGSESSALIPFVFLTAANTYEDIRLGMANGADDYLTKPFSVVDLISAVKIQFEKKAQRDSHITRTIEQLSLNIATSLPHELRTCLMIVDGYLQMLRADEPADGANTAVYKAMSDSTARLKSVAEKFIWYSMTPFLTPERSKTVAASASNELIRAAAVRVASHFERVADLTIELEDAALAIEGLHLSRIIEELVENAFKFSRPGTQVHIQGLVQETAYSLLVSDRGHGMTPQQVASVNAFMQFDRSRHEQPGLGLGLIIAKRLTTAAGGHLDIKSGAHQGTVITLTFQRLDVPSQRGSVRLSSGPGLNVHIGRKP